MFKADNYDTKKIFTYKPKGSDRVISLRELFEINPYGKYIVRSLYITHKNIPIGKSFVCVDGYIVELPSVLLNSAKAMLNSKIAIDSINQGMIGFIVYPYQSRRGAEYTLTWFDLDSINFDINGNALKEE